MSNQVVNAKKQDSNEIAPQNGIAGLKHWRHDMLAALVVSLVSVPLSLGIAMASGAPPICGLTSEIIAGLVFPFLGGAYVTVSGPAAGLAPILFTAITGLGDGDMVRGYHLVVGVILMTGIVQLILTYFKAAKFSQIFPTAAIHGMLAAIGFLLFAKQLPNFIGAPFHAHEFFSIMCETPSELLHHLHTDVFSIGIICLLLLFQLSAPQLRGGVLRYVPPQLIVVVVGVILAQLYHLDRSFLVSIPANPLEHGIVFPDFKALFDPIFSSMSEPNHAVFHLGYLIKIIFFVLALTFIDGTESLATIQAVDRIDPFHRKSSPDRTLGAMGISNICSSLIGGLTIIPGIIKSTTCIVSGGRTAWVNFYNALFLITFILLAGNIIKMIPVAALAAVLMHIGYKLAGLHKWRSMINLGYAQLLVFTVTIVVTLLSDLLMGIGAGMIVKCLVLVWYELKATKADSGSNIFKILVSLIRSPLDKIDTGDGVATAYFTGPIDCFNSLKVRSSLDKLTAEAESKNIKKLILHFSPTVYLIDHSMSIYFSGMRDDWTRLGKEIEFSGLQELKPSSNDPTSLKYRTA